MTALLLTITLKEPLLVSAPGGDPNSNLSLLYVPGSVIRGAILNRFIEMQSGGTGEFPDWFLNGGVKFLNAYPRTASGKRSLPIPSALVEDKNDPGIVINRLKELPPSAPKSIPQEFGWVEGNQLNAIEILDEITVHNARDREMGKAGSAEEGQEGAVFQYRALAPELVFDGVILMSAGVKDSEEILKSVLNSGPFWMGGSITAGYGKVEIRMKPSEGWREIPGNLHDIKSGEAFTAILLSDALVRDDNGQLGDNVVEALNSRLGDKSVGLESGYQRLHWVGGFNRTWGLPLPQEWAVQAGSSYKLKAQRKLSANELRSLEIEGLGERRSEGFGRVAFNWDFPSKLQTKDVASVQASSESTEMLAEEEQELADKMVDRWLQQRLDREVAAAINRTMSTVKGLDRISNSQLGRLRLQCREAARQRDMTPLKTYIRQVQVRSVARDQLQRVTVNGHNLLGWISAWANTDNNINSQFYIWDALNVKHLETYQIGARSGGISWQADSSLTHEYTVRLVDGLLARLMRQRRTEA